MVAPFPKANVDIFPLLCSFPHITTLFGGTFSEEVTIYCKEHQITTYDLRSFPELTAYNAIATAEGALALAMTLQPTNLSEGHCLVTGFGYCGKQIATMLRGLGAKVSVAVRNPALASTIAQMGFTYLSLEELDAYLCNCEYIFNTIPAVIFTKERLELLPREALLIDIASAPGGVDYDSARFLERKAHLCPALPGRFSPKSSGIKLAKLILQQLTTTSNYQEVL